MLRKRMLIGLGGCFLASGAAWADGVAYVDCASHPETTLVFGKPRRTPETVAAIACGERFTILQYGFIFSRVQTKDGQVGYVYSNLISADRSGAAVPQPATRVNAAPATVPTATSTVAPSNPAPVAQPQATSMQQPPVEAPAVAALASKTAAASVPIATPPTQTQVTVVESVPAQASAVVSAPAPATPSTSGVSDMRVTSVPPASAAPEQPKAAHVPSGETAAPAASVPEPSASVAPEAVAPATPTEATPAAQPEAAPAEPAAPIRAVRAKESWERPNAGGRRVVPLFDLFGGYGFARFDNGAGASASNLNGVIGSFGWNVKPWLQIVADSSYNFVTVSGVKSVMYGNHWGPRIFYRGRNRWGLTPFVEGLVGGTRADITVPGVGGYTTSQNVLSYKVGGGLDMKLSRKIEIRLLDVDYYRTSFGTNLYQNNYWASAGIVLRLFGGSE
jgi:hypothetical protein